MARWYTPPEMVVDGLYPRKQVLVFLLLGQLLDNPLSQMPHITLVLHPWVLFPHLRHDIYMSSCGQTPHLHVIRQHTVQCPSVSLCFHCIWLTSVICTKLPYLAKCPGLSHLQSPQRSTEPTWCRTSITEAWFIIQAWATTGNNTFSCNAKKSDLPMKHSPKSLAISLECSICCH